MKRSGGTGQVPPPPFVIGIRPDNKIQQPAWHDIRHTGHHSLDIRYSGR